MKRRWISGALVLDGCIDHQILKLDPENDSVPSILPIIFNQPQPPTSRQTLIDHKTTTVYVRRAWFLALVYAVSIFHLIMRQRNGRLKSFCCILSNSRFISLANTFLWACIVSVYINHPQKRHLSKSMTLTYAWNAGHVFSRPRGERVEQMTHLHRYPFME